MVYAHCYKDCLITVTVKFIGFTQL
jgi:hypothetical protein